MNRKVIYVILAAGLVLTLFTSCGEEGGLTLPCINCDYWNQAFGGTGRFPAVSPVDPNLIAFCSMRDGSGSGTYYHIWVVRLADTPGDTNWFYQITDESYDDFNPAWSPDGNLIAFERNVGGGDVWQIYVVDVSDLSNPGTPVPITEGVKDIVARIDSTLVSQFYSNVSPSWVTLGEQSYVCFCNKTKGGADSDISMIRYPDLDSVVTVTIDPSDYANSEGGVLSATFEDHQAYADGGRIVFASPNRKRVGDIRVVARSEEQPDTVVAADILINGKSSGKKTPYTFKYRPAGEAIEIAGELDGYCEAVSGSLDVEPDTLNLFIIDFAHTRGTLGVASDPGGMTVFIDGVQQFKKTPVNPDSFTYFTCLLPGTHVVETKNIYGGLCGVDSAVVIVAGGTTRISFVCGQPAVVDPGFSDFGSAPLNRSCSRPLATAASENAYGLWLIDLGSTPETSDDRIYLLDLLPLSIQNPVLSPDGRFVACIVGAGSSWNILVVDISQIGSGAPLQRYIVGLPGSSEDVECWREVERISWIPDPGKRQLAVSLSQCRGGMPDDFSIWIADLTDILK